MNGINKESQVSLIDFSESINVIKGGEGGILAQLWCGLLSAFISS